MTPEISLTITQTCVLYLLKTSFVFAVCCLLCKLIRSPHRRFVVWLSFLVGCVLWGSSFVLALVPQLHGVRVAEVTSSTVHAATGAYSPITFLLPAALVSVLGYLLDGLGVFYLLTFSFLFINALRNRLRLRWVLRFTYPPPSEVADLFAPLAEQFGFAGCRLRVLSGIASPATIGWWSPMILLPDFCTTFDHKKLSHILSHELHHIRRRDFLWDGLASICRTLLFFHPAAHFAVRQLRLERELCCDLLVVGEAPDVRADYAESLLSFAQRRSYSDDHAWGVDFAAPVKQLKTRLRLILASSKRLPLWIVTLRSTCGAALLLLLVIAMPLIAVVFHVHAPATIISNSVETSTIPQIKHHRSSRKNISPPAAIAQQLAVPPASFDSTIQPPPSLPMSMSVALMVSTQELHPHVTIADNSDEGNADEARASSPSPGSSVPPRLNRPAFPSWTSMATAAARQIGSMGGHDRDHDHD
jgi:beta-lactamase regulating signal transducer with metallopeptidase domain